MIHNIVSAWNNNVLKQLAPQYYFHVITFIVLTDVPQKP